MQSYGNLPLTCTYEDFHSLFSSFMQLVKGEFHMICMQSQKITGRMIFKIFKKIIMRPVITGRMIFFITMRPVITGRMIFPCIR